MTPEERDRMLSLCNDIAKEKDTHKFHELVHELNNLIERKDSRLTQPLCAICGKPCDLRTCKVDENGKAVHGECLAAKMAGAKV
jgi:hypothetical protein